MMVAVAGSMASRNAKLARGKRDMAEIVACDRITGEDCYLARAHLRSVAELEKLIDKLVPYAMTNTSIIQSSPVKRRLPPIAQAPHNRTAAPPIKSDVGPPGQSTATSKFYRDSPA